MHPGCRQVSTGATILAPLGPVLSPSERAFFAEADPWAFIVFARNLESADQIRRLTADLRDSVGRDAIIFIDQEGGRVQRLEPPLARRWLPPLDEVRRAGANAAKVMNLRYRIIAAELRALGIDGNCAPMSDVARADTHPILKNRCYGYDVEDVIEVARAVADGLIEGGVAPVLKHIPGHGAATVDSHLELPRVDLPLGALWKQDFDAVANLSQIPLAMTAHVVFEALDPDLPATLSETVISYLRKDIYDGVLMSDDISMQALSGPIGERSAKAIAAGCDLILHCNGDMAEMEQVAAHAGRITSQRTAAAMATRGKDPQADLAALSAEWQALTGDRPDA